MKVFGKTISEYVAFEKWFLLLVLVVGLARLSLSLAGVSVSVDKYLSLTVLMLLGLLYYSIRVYTSGFGSYKQLLPVLFLQWLTGQCIVIAGIAIAMASAKDNIFSAPEFSPTKTPGSGRTLGHLLSHVGVIVVGPLVCWLVGMLIMFITKKVARGGEQKAGVSAA